MSGLTEVITWKDITDLTKLTYQNIIDIYKNMKYIIEQIGSSAAINSPDYDPIGGVIESTGCGTDPRDILAKMNRTENNLNTLHGENGVTEWINPYYLRAVTWIQNTQNKYERVKRWIDCLNLDKSVIDGDIPMPEYLFGYDDDGANNEQITGSDGEYIVCYGTGVYS